MGMSEPSAKPPQISVIVPARNEEANLKTCLDSLAGQDFSFEVIVVNDHSTDRTKEIAESYGWIRVIDSPELPTGWTGKNNAVAAGARAARTDWFLFTDADTVHLPGSLGRAFAEAKANHAELLSYSPEQITGTFWEKATLPVVFSELARQYPPSKVSDPKSPEAAANGQYLLVSREAYEAVGGHTAVAGEILEDVAFARAVKASGRKIRFRYAADAVRTRMYRNFQQLREGWTKNLVLLFPHPSWLAAKTLFLWGVPWAVLALGFVGRQPLIWYAAIATLGWLLLAGRLLRANFGIAKSLLAAVFGMPMFACLLLRSRRAHAKGKVSWKGRTYGDRDVAAARTTATSIIPGKLS